MCIKSVKNIQFTIRFSKYVVMFILLNKMTQATTNFVANLNQKNIYSIRIQKRLFI